MNVLFDACVPRPLRKHLPGIDIKTAYEMGWAHLLNGHLLRTAQQDFDVLLTVDRGIRYQQPAHEFEIGIVIVLVFNNNVKSFLPLLDEIREAISRVKPGEVLIVGKR